VFLPFRFCYQLVLFISLHISARISQRNPESYVFAFDRFPKRIFCFQVHFSGVFEAEGARILLALPSFKKKSHIATHGLFFSGGTRSNTFLEKLLQELCNRFVQRYNLGHEMS